LKLILKLNSFFSSKEFLILGAYFFITFNILLLKNKIKKVLFSKFYVENKIFLDTLFSIFISILFILLGIFSSKFCFNKTLKIFLVDTSVFLSGIFLIKSTKYIKHYSEFEKRKDKKVYLPYIFFTFSYLLSILGLLLKNKNIFFTLIKIKKFFVVLGVLFLLWNLKDSIKQNIIRKIYETFIILFSPLILILWETEHINLNYKTLLGISLIIFLTTLYIYLYSKVIKLIKEHLKNELSKEDIETIEYHLKIFISTLYILLTLTISFKLFNFSLILTKLGLDNLYIFKSDLIEISVSSLIKTTFLSIILFNILNISKKLIKLLFPKERREVEGGSAEALIFNLGVLFNIMIILSSLGITWKAILPIAGTLGVGLGFGLQTIMNNYVSGFILLFSKKLKVGDIVELPSVSVSTLGTKVNSVFGKVEDIGILSTIIRTNDGVEISIPNSSFINSPIVNFSYKDPYVRLKIPVSVSYSSDPMKVKQVLEDVILNLPFVEKDFPICVRFEEIGDSALIFKAIFWIDIRKNLRVRNVVSNFYFKAWYKLKEAGIEIPFPQQDVWFRNNLKVEIENFKNYKINDNENKKSN